MRNFGYCIWFTSSSFPLKINKLTNGFQPHMSVKTHYSSLAMATKFFNKLPVKIKIPIVFDKMVYSPEENGFTSLYFTIKPSNDPSTIWWWPENAHISMHYTYDSSISEKIKEEIYKKVSSLQELTLDGFQIMNCNGNFHNWKRML